MMYTYTAGNNHAPTGILFHSAPPLLTEVAHSALGFSQASTASGASSETVLFSTGNWQNQGDTSAIFSIGGDRAGSEGTGQYISRVPGSDGTAGTQGGWHFIWGFPVWSAQTNAGAAGAFIQQTNVSPGVIVTGGFQQSSTAQRNSPYVFDLVLAAAPNTGYALGGLCADASTNSFAYVTTSSFSGTGCRFNALWACCNITAGQTAVTPMPTPQVAWTASTQVTNTLLNGSISNALQFLNVPPSLRCGTALSTAIAANTPTLVPLTSPQLDPFAGFSSNTYTVQVSGVYLVHGYVVYSKPTSGDTYAGINVNGTVYYGPSYTVTGAAVTTVQSQVTRLLDLQAGDTVKLFAFATTATTLNSGQPCRLIVKWMAPIAGSSGSVSFTSPDMWFRWQAGTAGSSTPAQFTKAIGNDTNFLLNRPYLIAHQTSAQTALTPGSWITLTMTDTGLVHGSAGDNYGGWTTGASNHYSAVVPGWYLVVVNGVQASPATPSVHEAGIGYFTPTGSNQGSTSPDVYQIIASNTSTQLPGADAIGLYYLNTGDRVSPMYQEISGANPYATTVSSGHQSSFGVVWVSELWRVRKPHARAN